RDQVSPDFAIRKLLSRRERTVRIDVVTAVNEEIGAVLAHGGIGAHAAAALIDAPTASCRVARPDKGYGLLFCRCRAESSDLRLVKCGCIWLIREPYWEEQVLPRRQALHQDFGGEVGFRQRVDKSRAADVAEHVGRCNLDQHAGGAVGATPYDRGID